MTLVKVAVVKSILSLPSAIVLAGRCVEVNVRRGSYVSALWARRHGT